MVSVTFLLQPFDQQAIAASINDRLTLVEKSVLVLEKTTFTKDDAALMRAEMKKDAAEMRAEMKKDAAEMRADMKADMRTTLAISLVLPSFTLLRLFYKDYEEKIEKEAQNRKEPIERKFADDVVKLLNYFKFW
jgi:hypothetical protein